MVSTVTIPESALRETARWMVDLRDYWHDELPMQLHSGSLDDGGAPQWHPQFARWLGVDYYGKRSDQRWSDNPEPRIRTTRAFRKLRKKAVREFEVCYRIIILGDPITGTCTWLNERALRNNIPFPEPPKTWDGQRAHYEMHDTMLLLMSGVSKIASWW